VNQEYPPRLEPNNQILAAPLDGLHRLALQLGGHLSGLNRAGDARVEDLDPLEPSPDQHRLEAGANRLDLGKLRHAASLAARART